MGLVDDGFVEVRAEFVKLPISVVDPDFNELEALWR